MRLTQLQRNRLDALAFAVELGEAKGGSPIPLEKVASVLQLGKVLKKCC